MRAVTSYGSTIRRLRKERGWRRQEDLAEAAGVDKETVVRAESSGSVSTGKLAQLAAALGVELSDLFCQPAPPQDEDCEMLSRLKEPQRVIVRRMMRSYLGLGRPSASATRRSRR
jgi:transcriptional regulator with XRE-family HTH domain